MVFFINLTYRLFEVETKHITHHEMSSVFSKRLLLCFLGSQGLICGSFNIYDDYFFFAKRKHFFIKSIIDIDTNPVNIRCHYPGSTLSVQHLLKKKNRVICMLNINPIRCKISRKKKGKIKTQNLQNMQESEQKL